MLGNTLRCTISSRMTGWRVTSLPSSLGAEGDLPREGTLQARRVCGGGRSRGSGTAPPGGRAAADQEPGCTRAGLSRGHDTRTGAGPSDDASHTRHPGRRRLGGLPGTSQRDCKAPRRGAGVRFPPSSAVAERCNVGEGT